MASSQIEEFLRRGVQFGLDMIAISRPLTCCAEGLWVWVGARIVADGQVHSAVWPSIVSVVLLTASAQSFNDAEDIVGDKLTRPNRPLPSGRVSVSQARLYSFTCVIAGVVAASIASLHVAVLAAFIGVGGLSYSRWLKRIPMVGNLTVAAVACTPVFLGAVTIERPNLLIFIAMAMVASQMLGYEILKDVRDIDDDSRVGLRSFAAAVSTVTWVWVVRVSLIVAASFALAPWFTTATGGLYYLMIAVPLVFVPNAVAAALCSNPERSSVARWLIVGSWFPALLCFYLLPGL